METGFHVGVPFNAKVCKVDENKKFVDLLDRQSPTLSLQNILDLGSKLSPWLDCVLRVMDVVVEFIFKIFTRILCFKQSRLG